MRNPFITNGYVDDEHFCDRVNETRDMLELLKNGNNIALISQRRYGKTDLIRHCFAQPEIKDDYYSFIIDIYATRSLSDLVERIVNAILETLKPRGKRVWMKFLNTVASLKSYVTFDAMGQPSWGVGLGDLPTPATTLDEIFHYLQEADKPCLVAIDEFQQILKYSEQNVEATLRTMVHYCSNANFVFSGSQRHLMGSIFTSPARPFYQSVTIMNLNPIPLDKYNVFCIDNFLKYNKTIDKEVVDVVYSRFEGATFYMQKMMNILFMRTDMGGRCTLDMVDESYDYIVDFSHNTYQDFLYQLPDKQCRLLKAICLEGKARQVTSGAFVKKYNLASASSVSSALKALLEKDMVTSIDGAYQVYDKFFAYWLRREFFAGRI